MPWPATFAARSQAAHVHDRQGAHPDARGVDRVVRPERLEEEPLGFVDRLARRTAGAIVRSTIAASGPSRVRPYAKPDRPLSASTRTRKNSRWRMIQVPNSMGTARRCRIVAARTRTMRSTSGHRAAHAVRYPSSHMIVWPVTSSEASLARKIAAPMSSRGRPSRGRSMRALMKSAVIDVRCAAWPRERRVHERRPDAVDPHAPVAPLERHRRA